MKLTQIFGGLAVLAIVGWSSTAAIAQQKTVKACQQEWQSQKTAMQAAGITEKAYVDKCRAGTAAAPAAAPSAAPAAPATAAKPVAPPPAATAKPRAPASPAASGTPSGVGQFASEAQAKAQCPTDTVVWVNTASGIYHFSGTKDYGTTKKGAYMCEKNTAAAGFRAAKNEKHP